MVCKAYKHVNFIIGGDGDKMVILKDLREKFGLHDRIELLGALEHR